MSADSPASVLFDVNGNPVGTIIDGVFYRLQVEAKLAAGSATIGKIDQGVPAVSANAWPVSVQNAALANLQQLIVETKISVDGYNLDASAYSENVLFSNDSFLAVLELRFSTTIARNIIVSLNDGTVLFSEIANTSLFLEIDFENYAIDANTTLTLTISETTGACLTDITLTAKVGGPVLEANPVLGAGTNHIGSVAIDTGGKTGSGDAFGRLRTSAPQSIFEFTHQYDLAPQHIGLQRQDAGTTITHSSPVAILAVPAVSGRKIVYQSHQYATYLPGKSQIIRMTGVLDSGISISGMGYGDGYDGIFLENGASGMQIRFLSSTISGQVVTQNNWNLDKLDGYGTSGITLNVNNAQQLIIDLSWLGVGRVRVGLDIGGLIVYAHQFLFSNLVATAYMRTGSLPVRWYLESLGTATDMKAICASVSSEGGHDPIGVAYSYARTTSKTTLAVGVRTPLISLRPKLLYNSLESHVNIILSNISFLGSTVDNLLVEVIKNGTLTAASWVSAGTESHAEIDESATAITGGASILSDYVSSQSRGLLNPLVQDNLKTLPLTLSAAGIQDIITVCVTRIEGSASAYAGINWREVK